MSHLLSYRKKGPARFFLVLFFRSRYWPRNTIPVDIFEIVEFELGIEIRTIFNLREAGDVDALLLGDLKTIVVDQIRKERATINRYGVTETADK